MSVRYVTQAGTVDDDGLALSTAYSLATLNTGNWGTLTNPIVPGDTLNVSGTITGVLYVRGDGTDVNYITIDLSAATIDPTTDTRGFVNNDQSQVGGSYIIYDGGTFEGGTTDASYNLNASDIIVKNGTWNDCLKFVARESSINNLIVEDTTFNGSGFTSSETKVLVVEQGGSDHSDTTPGVYNDLIIRNNVVEAADLVAGFEHRATSGTFYDQWLAERRPYRMQHTGNYIRQSDQSGLQQNIGYQGSIAFNHLREGIGTLSNSIQVGGNDGLQITDNVVEDHYVSTSGDGNCIILDRVPTSAVNENPSVENDVLRNRLNTTAGTLGTGAGVSAFRSRDSEIVSNIMDACEHMTRETGENTALPITGDLSGDVFAQNVGYNLNVAGHVVASHAEAHAFYNNIVHTAPEGIQKPQASGELPAEKGNFYYNITNDEIDNNGTPESIDITSSIEDPLLLDPANGDFRLSTRSPAGRGGFNWYQRAPLGFDQVAFS